MVSRGCPIVGFTREGGQASLLLLGVLAALLAGTLVLFGLGQALGARGQHQRAADLAAVSAAQIMRRHYPRLFEPAFLEDGVPNPRHLSTAAYLSLARAAAERGARRNGVRTEGVSVEFPDQGFAPTRVTVTVAGSAEVRLPAADRGDRVDVRARATAELTPADDLGIPVDGGGYDGPLAYRQGKPMRPDVALAFDRMAAAARREAGLYLSITSGFRSDAEQARLWAANPDPKWVAPPGTSLHRYGTELDLGPPAAYGWLEANCGRFGFVKRYSWEDWHYGLPLAHKSALGLDRCAQRTIPHQAATLLLRAPRDGRPLQCSVSTEAALARERNRALATPGSRPGR
jgi:hypothetical protein